MKATASTIVLEKAGGEHDMASLAEDQLDTEWS